MADTEQVESKDEFGKPPVGSVGQWLAEIRAYERTFKSWEACAKANQKRYRNEAEAEAGNNPAVNLKKFNILWSNVETLKPALFGRVPNADISRKHKDRNPIGRAAAVILERTTQDQIASKGFEPAMRSSVLDYLLAARGQSWVRYVPTYGEETRDRIFLQEDVGEDGSKVYRRETEGEEGETEELAEPQFTDDGRPYIEDGEPYRPVVSECTEQDHVNWKSFGHTPAPSWKKVRAVWKMELMTRSQLVERFGKEIGEKVALGKKLESVGDDDVETYGDVFRRAEVYEIWDKTSHKVLWISPGYGDGPLDAIDDPLHLEGFFPCPPPLLGTVTTDSLVPVSDYDEYRTQADEIDRLTQRIHMLLQAIGVKGVYDGSISADLQNVLTGGDNQLVAVDNWAMFAEKGGIKGVVDFFPMREIAETVVALNEAREQLKNDIYELTGLSDIVRGQQTDGAPRTAREQGIKAQYAGMRISDRQLAVSRFARDVVQIVAEIVAEHFSPDTLWEASGWEHSDEARAIDQAYSDWEETQQAVMEAQAEFEGQMQAYQELTAQGQEAEQPEPPEMTPADIPPPPMTSKEVFDEAVELLRSDRTRGFTIDIETDSMVLEDQQQEQQNRIELVSTATEFLNVALPAAEQFPEMKPLFGELLMFAVRGFKTGRTLEAAFEGAMENMTSADQDEEEQQTDPVEAAKAQASMAKVQIDGMKLQLEKAKAEAANQLEQMKLAAEAQSRAMEQRMAEMEAMIKTSEIKADVAKARQEGSIRMAEVENENMRIRQDGAVRGAELEQTRMRDEADTGLKVTEIESNAIAAEGADGVKLEQARMAQEARAKQQSKEPGK